MQRIVAAARELAAEAGSAGFTVAQVAERAGLSLKTVYRAFTGKDEILVALLEEESRVGAEIVSERLAVHDDPVARAQAFVGAIFELLTHPGAGGYAGVLVREHRRLTEEDPVGLRAALAPLVDLLAAAIADAASQGVADPGDARRAADTVFDLMLGGIAEVTLAGADPAEQAAWIWRFAASGLGMRSPR